MRWLVVAALMIIPAALAVSKPAASRPAASCGYERWPVKTLADPAGRKLKFNHPVPSTVAILDTLPIVDGGQSTRGQGFERTTFQVTAFLVGAKIEADSDVHLVLRDLKRPATLIAEIPALGCTAGARPAARKLMQRARVAFLRACGDPGATDFSYYRPRTKITVTGVGFFDTDHGQTGVAPNAIELHPVIKLAIGRCR